MTVEWRSVVGWGQEEIDELRSIAYAYMRQGQMTLAHTFFEALVVLQPNSLYDLRMLASLRDLLGDPAGAIEVYQQLLKNEPNDLFASIGLSKALLATGQRGPAMERLRLLSTCANRLIANDAQALLLAYA